MIDVVAGEEAIIVIRRRWKRRLARRWDGQTTRRSGRRRPTVLTARRRRRVTISWYIFDDERSGGGGGRKTADAFRIATIPRGSVLYAASLTRVPSATVFAGQFIHRSDPFSALFRTPSSTLRGNVITERRNCLVTFLGIWKWSYCVHSKSYNQITINSNFTLMFSFYFNLMHFTNIFVRLTVQTLQRSTCSLFMLSQYLFRSFPVKWVHTVRVYLRIQVTSLRYLNVVL